MPKTIAIANQKGGVGKTTTALNLAAGLHEKEKKVLLIDLDPQGHLSEYLGHSEDDAPTISELLSDAVNGRSLDIGTAIRTNHEGIDYIPSNIQLSSADFFLINAMMREQVLKRVLDVPVVQSYDYVLIDCLPSLGILLINALAACESVIIPVQTQKFALDGLGLLMNVLDNVRQNVNQRLRLEGILVTMCDNTNMSRAVEEALRKSYGEYVFRAGISRSVRAAESTYEQKSLLLSNNSKLREQYRQLAEEVLNQGV